MRFLLGVPLTICSLGIILSTYENNYGAMGMLTIIAFWFIAVEIDETVAIRNKGEKEVNEDEN